LRCPRCFYLDRRLGIDQPSGPPYTLNSAVDHLLKKEFDVYRTKQAPHPIMAEHGIDAVPFVHEKLDEWRENFKGVRYLHEPTNFLFFGAVDDVWKRNDNGKLIVVDYKSTSKEGDITLDAEWHQSYKRQMEIYQWLLSRNGFEVDPTGYFVYVNALKTEDGFNCILKFKAQLISYTGSDAWVEDALIRAHACLMADRPPSHRQTCAFCNYSNALSRLSPA
jgi:hypothetical protein